MKFREDYTKKFNKKVKLHEFSRGHLVYLHRPELIKFGKGLQSPWFGPYLILDIIHNNALIQDLASKKTRFVNINRLRMYDISPDEWKKFKLIKSETVDNIVSVDDYAKSPSQSSSKTQEYASFDIANDVVCLNPQAATESRPIPIKVEALGERGTIDSPELQDVVSPVADGSPQGKFLTSLTNTFDEVFGLNPGLDLDTNSEKIQKCTRIIEK